MSNHEYAKYCSKDGWDVTLLNTGATVSYLLDEEKNLILAINMVRTNPPRFAELYVKEVISYYEGKFLIYPNETPISTREGKALAIQLYNILLKTKPMQILTPSWGMSKAAREHAQNQSITGAIGHGPGNASSRRLMKYGQWSGCMAENISYGLVSGHRALISLLIDDGVPSRGHRNAILNKNFTKIGVGSAPHKKYEWSFVITLACDYTEKTQK